MIEAHDIRKTKVKKLGSMIGETADMQYRIQRAAHAFRTQWTFFRHSSHIPLHVRIRMYNAYVLPLLTYNLAANGLTMAQMKPLDVAHRIIARIFFPNRISNKALYALTNTTPISQLAIRYRWAFFGHLLRRPDDNPALQVMISYFTHADTHDPRLGRPMSSLPMLLDDDLSHVKNMSDIWLTQTQQQQWHRPNPRKQRASLRDLQDLHELRAMAQDRHLWWRLSKRIYDRRTTAEEDRTPAPKRHKEQKDRPRQRKKPRQDDHNNNLAMDIEQE
jgi:hypothetical protein